MKTAVTDIKAALELLRTLFFLELCKNFFELYSKCFELRNYWLYHKNIIQIPIDNRKVYVTSRGA